MCGRQYSIEYKKRNFKNKEGAFESSLHPTFLACGPGLLNNYCYGSILAASDNNH